MSQDDIAEDMKALDAKCTRLRKVFMLELDRLRTLSMGYQESKKLIWCSRYGLMHVLIEDATSGLGSPTNYGATETSTRPQSSGYERIPTA